MRWRMITAAQACPEGIACSQVTPWPRGLPCRSTPMPLGRVVMATLWWPQQAPSTGRAPWGALETGSRAPSQGKARSEIRAPCEGRVHSEIRAPCGGRVHSEIRAPCEATDHPMALYAAQGHHHQEDVTYRGQQHLVDFHLQQWLGALVEGGLLVIVSQHLRPARGRCPSNCDLEYWPLLSLSVLVHPPCMLTAPSLLAYMGSCRACYQTAVTIHWSWARSRNCGCLVTWFCYQMIAKPGNKTATVPWPDPVTAAVYKAIKLLYVTDACQWDHYHLLCIYLNCCHFFSMKSFVFVLLPWIAVTSNILLCISYIDWFLPKYSNSIVYALELHLFDVTHRIDASVQSYHTSITNSLVKGWFCSKPSVCC